jgi:prepilin-type N-terminal cleavage/methylation domain-containing protein
MVKFMNKNKCGFTLIELLVVISIIGILMGLLISQLGGILGSSEKTKIEAIMRSWIISLNEYKSHYGYYPPFLYGEEEGTPILMGKDDNYKKLIVALNSRPPPNILNPTDAQKFSDQNLDKMRFHNFIDSEIGADGILVKSLSILVDVNGDGFIELDKDTSRSIVESAMQDVDESQRENFDKADFYIINEKIAMFILEDEKLGVSNIFSWNMEKYFE